MGEVTYVDTLNAAWDDHQAEREPQAPTVASLFAGCGGSSLGYSMAGFREVLAAEWEANAVETFKLNFKDVPVFHGDVANLSAEAFLERAGLEAGELDVLDGSPPCQGFSTAGRRVLEDDRNSLFREYVRLLRAARPRVLVMENVTGLVKGKMRLVFAEIMRELRACGYRVSARALNAQYYGVPQARERLIFIGVRSDIRCKPSHPVGRVQPITAAQALEGVDVDPDEHAMLIAAGKKYSAFRDWHRIVPGGSVADVSTSGFSGRKYKPHRPAYTITKTDGQMGLHGAMHWSERRRFSVAEFKRFGSFPDQFRFAGDWSDAVARIGNSVPPLLMRAIAEHLRSEVLADG